MKPLPVLNVETMNYVQVINMRRYIFLITLVLLAVSAVHVPEAAITGKTVIFVPFYDESGYRGPWNLRMEVPQMLGDMLGGADDYFTVIPVDSVATKLPAPPLPNLLQRVVILVDSLKEKQDQVTEKF